MRFYIIILLICVSIAGYGTYLMRQYPELQHEADEALAVDTTASATEVPSTPPVPAPTPTTTEPVTPTPPPPVASAKPIPVKKVTPIVTPKSAPQQVMTTQSGPAGDTTPPTAPTNVQVEVEGSDEANISWDASTDNVGVVGYDIFRDGVQIGSADVTYFADVGVVNPAYHKYAVRAVDAAGNVSTLPMHISATTAGSSGTTAAVPSSAPTSSTPTPAAAPATPSTPATPATTQTPASTPAAAPKPAPTLSFSASPTSLTSGASATLSWTAANATACTASGSWTGSKQTSGSQSVSPTADASYSLACTGDGGSVTKSASISVTTPAPAAAGCGSGGACSAADVASHNSAGNCWVYLSPLNKVYNITGYLSGGSHPGGNVIAPYCGQNIYAYFIQSAGGHRHSSAALNTVLQAYYIGPFQ